MCACVRACKSVVRSILPFSFDSSGFRGLSIMMARPKKVSHTSSYAFVPSFPPQQWDFSRWHDQANRVNDVFALRIWKARSIFFPKAWIAFVLAHILKENYSIYRRNGTGREFAYSGSELGLSFRPHDFFWSIFKGKEHRRSFNVGRRRAMIANHDLTHTMKFAKEHLLTKSRDVNSLHTCTVLACSTLKFNILVIKPWKQIKA